jgi:hypothetical protein
MINFITISILDFGVTSHNVIDQSMIINFEMKKISGGEAKQNPREHTILWCIWVKSHPFLYRKTPNISINAFIIILFYAFTYIANWDI